MPRTICSDFSHHNLSISNSQDPIKAGIKKKKRRIDKRKPKAPHDAKKLACKNRNIIMNRKLCKKLVYSPEYAININEVSTPLYHSDQHQPTIEASSEMDERPFTFKTYITYDVLMQMVKEAEEERANQLVQQMKTFQISSMEEEFPIE